MKTRMTRLSTDILLVAYSNGFFPMPHPQTQEICWFNPDPRAIIPLDGFHVSRSLKRTLRKQAFRISINEAFESVIDACADREETWINDEIKATYTQLYLSGHAHSLEVWEDTKLVGGVYGVAIGAAFFAESKFHRVRDASKVALYYLVEHLKAKGFQILEVQFLIPHLARLGAIEIPLNQYLENLSHAIKLKATFTDFKLPPPP
jgi:leucyl/phenylalanyl-tRNA--protein transferase